MLLDVQGTMGMSGGERVIRDPVMISIGNTAAPEALCLTNRDAGGSASHVMPGQQGITDASGLNNIGLLISVSGRVTGRGTTGSPSTTARPLA